MGITNKYYSEAGLGCLSWLGCYERYELGLAQMKVRNLAGGMMSGKMTSTSCTESALGELLPKGSLGTPLFQELCYNSLVVNAKFLLKLFTAVQVLVVQFSLMIWAQTSPAASTVQYFVTNIVYLAKKKPKTFFTVGK